MENYRYRLASNKVKKGRCPKCGHNAVWQRYLNADGNVMPEEYGRCDRESKCGHWVRPTHNRISVDFTPPPSRTPVHLPTYVWKETQQGTNTFIEGLKAYFTDIDEVINRYRLGTNPHQYLHGAVCFPYYDHKENLRTIQMRLYDDNLKGIGNGFLHKAYKAKSWYLEYDTQEKKLTCLFGAHLLPLNKEKTVVIVEAPKTAVIGSLWLPQYLWLSCTSLSGLTKEKLLPLAGRGDVFLFPDLSQDGQAFRKWKEKTEQLNIPGVEFHMVDLLEGIATEEQKQSGDDLADFILSSLSKQEPERRRRKLTPEEIEADKDFWNEILDDYCNIYYRKEIESFIKMPIPEGVILNGKEMQDILERRDCIVEWIETAVDFKSYNYAIKIMKEFQSEIIEGIIKKKVI